MWVIHAISPTIRIVLSRVSLTTIQPVVLMTILVELLKVAVKRIMIVSTILNVQRIIAVWKPMEQNAVKLLAENQVRWYNWYLWYRTLVILALHLTFFIINWYLSLVHGGWGRWRIVSVDHCEYQPNAPVKLIRLCDSPSPQYGGNLCPNAEYNERYISCSETNYEGRICHFCA